MRSIAVQLPFNVTAGQMYDALLVTKLRLSLSLLRAAAVALLAHLNLQMSLFETSPLRHAHNGAMHRLKSGGGWCHYAGA